MVSVHSNITKKLRQKLVPGVQGPDNAVVWKNVDDWDFGLEKQLNT